MLPNGGFSNLEVGDNTPEFKVLCPFCNSVYTAEMVDGMWETDGYDTDGYGGTTTGRIDVICENCKRVVYRKEVSHFAS